MGALSRVDSDTVTNECCCKLYLKIRRSALNDITETALYFHSKTRYACDPQVEITGVTSVIIKDSALNVSVPLYCYNSTVQDMNVSSLQKFRNKIKNK
jgi:hypothetical protein